uniref:Uncharacterized protein n=1 Tax=Arion vulgaris TaxID=1028688 RepID=A0A0B7BDV5_9EUPU
MCWGFFAQDHQMSRCKNTRSARIADNHRTAEAQRKQSTRKDNTQHPHVQP